MTHTITLFDRGFIPSVKRYILEKQDGYRFSDAPLPPVFIAWLISWLPGLREAARASVLWVPGPPKGRLLDVGCGNGEFLQVMKRLGWEVEGLEPDPIAVETARRMYGLKVECGDLSRFSDADESYDVVTLSHVLEHVPDPIEMLKRCWERVKSGGRLVVVTPNFESLGSRWFGASWFALEPPRHLYLFTKLSLWHCARKAGLTAISIRTTARMARWIWSMSWDIARHQRPARVQGRSHGSVITRATGVVFQMVEHLLNDRFPVGEELVLQAIRFRS